VLKELSSVVAFIQDCFKDRHKSVRTEVPSFNSQVSRPSVLVHILFSVRRSDAEMEKRNLSGTFLINYSKSIL
jgi:hypothetical protein